MISPIFLSDENSISAINQAIENNSLIMVCTGKNE
jgi:hypothetical protein